MVDRDPRRAVGGECRATPRAAGKAGGDGHCDPGQGARLVLRYAFEDLELNRVELTTDEDNRRAIRCYEKCGFAREALLRQHRLIDGKFGNTLVMAVLREEWESGQ
ncbi:MAG: GNAT family N-acetyltransferase [Chloroflexi bacterium]|nr:MAG: GNAT family N-acetyltransferase [Chloroflexota bacterium]